VKNRTKSEEKNEFFDGVKAGLDAAIAHAKGKSGYLRSTTFSHPPKPTSASESAKKNRKDLPEP